MDEEANEKKEANDYLIDPSNSLLLISRLILPNVLKDINDASKILLIHDEVHEIWIKKIKKNLGNSHDKFIYNILKYKCYPRERF